MMNWAVVLALGWFALRALTHGLRSVTPPGVADGHFSVAALEMSFRRGEISGLDRELDRAETTIRADLDSDMRAAVAAAAQSGVMAVAGTDLPHALLLRLSDNSQLLIATSDAVARFVLIEMLALFPLQLHGVSLEGQALSISFCDGEGERIDTPARMITFLPAPAIC